MPETKQAKPWVYTHPTDHPDNKPPVTIVAESTEEAVKAYEEAVNAVLEKEHPETDTPAIEPQTAPVNYEEKTVAELKELAAEKGVDLPWDARKEDIVKALEKHDKKGK